MTSFDFVIIGGGIVGLSIAKSLNVKYPEQSVCVIEKEAQPGFHASGRNSGVLHSGVYYPKDSLKLKLCQEGASLLRAYAQEHHLEFKETGKLILPVKEADLPIFDRLHQQALDSGIRVERLDERTINQLEPSVTSVLCQGLYLPDTASFNPSAIVSKLYSELTDKKVTFLLGHRVVDIKDSKKMMSLSNGGKIYYGKLLNAAGAYADRLAHLCGVGKQYCLLPFKGSYYKLAPHSKIKIRHHVYPVPDLNIPFLGVHFTITTDGYVTVGPSAVPALGPENYHGLEGVDLISLPQTVSGIVSQYLNNTKGFREYTHQEAIRLFKPKFVEAAKTLVPKITTKDLIASHKVGIRAQLYNRQKKQLEMDFLVETAENSVHILNAVSPAFTSGLSFGQWVVQQYV